MRRVPHLMRQLLQRPVMLLTLLADAVRFIRLCLRSPVKLVVDNLFLRQQLALRHERNVTPKRATHTTRFTLAWLGRWFAWWQALRVVQPETFLRRHRQEFRLLWRWQSRPDWPQIPVELQVLICSLALENPTWG